MAGRLGASVIIAKGGWKIIKLFSDGTFQRAHWLSGPPQISGHDTATFEVVLGLPTLIVIRWRGGGNRKSQLFSGEVGERWVYVHESLLR